MFLPGLLASIKAFVFFHSLEETSDFDVRIAGMRILYFGPLAEWRIRLIEETASLPLGLQRLTLRPAMDRGMPTSGFA
jgi:hypothetical protein